MRLLLKSKSKYTVADSCLCMCTRAIVSAGILLVPAPQRRHQKTPQPASAVVPTKGIFRNCSNAYLRSPTVLSLLDGTYLHKTPCMSHVSDMYILYLHMSYTLRM